MKKLLLSLFVVIGILLPITANAQICRIAGTNDTIELFDSSHAGNVIKMTFSNDSRSAANVSVVITVTYRQPQNPTPITRTYKKKALIQPLQSTEVSVIIKESIIEDNRTYNFESYTVDSITGTKCLSNN